MLDASETLELARKLGLRNTEALALSALALARARQGEGAREREFAAAAGLAKESGHREVTLLTEYRRALALGAAGSKADGEAALRALGETARREGFLAIAKRCGG